MATLLETNNRFIEAYLVGLNHEMARELLWREYPTDQRGTYFASFWTGKPELVADLHELPWRTGGLGEHVDPALDGQASVFLVRGDLIRRYPGVVAHAARAGQDRDCCRRSRSFEPRASPIKTLFHVFLPPNVLLVGFAMTEGEIDTPAETWWFTLSENPTEPRFGLDPSRDAAAGCRRATTSSGTTSGSPSPASSWTRPATCRLVNFPTPTGGAPRARRSPRCCSSSRPGPRSWASAWSTRRWTMADLELARLSALELAEAMATADRAYADLNLRLRESRGLLAAARAAGDEDAAAVAREQVEALLAERRTTLVDRARTHDRFADDLVNLLGDEHRSRGRRPAGAAAGAGRVPLDPRPGGAQGPDLSRRPARRASRRGPDATPSDRPARPTGRRSGPTATRQAPWHGSGGRGRQGPGAVGGRGAAPDQPGRPAGRRTRRSPIRRQRPAPSRSRAPCPTGSSCASSRTVPRR